MIGRRYMGVYVLEEDICEVNFGVRIIFAHF